MNLVSNAIFVRDQKEGTKSAPPSEGGKEKLRIAQNAATREKSNQ